MTLGLFNIPGFNSFGGSQLITLFVIILQAIVRGVFGIIPL